MDIGKVVAVLEAPTEEAVSALLDDDTTVFWIDWRQEDETIAESCESVLQTCDLTGELVEVDSEHGFEVYVQYRDNRVKVPLNYRGFSPVGVVSMGWQFTPTYSAQVNLLGSAALMFQVSASLR